MQTTEQVIQKYLFAFFILLLGAFIFYGLSAFLNAFLGAVVFYVLFKNFMFFLTRKKKYKKWLSAVIIILISFLIVVLPLGFLSGMIFNKAKSITTDPKLVTQYIDKLMSQVNQLPFETVSPDALSAKIGAFVSDHIAAVFTSSLDMIGSLLMMYFFLYFLLISHHSLEARIIYFLPFKKSKILLFGKELVEQTYSNAVGVPLVSLVQGIFAYICYRIGDVPDSGLWAVLTGCATIIPIVGTAIIWIPIVLFSFAENNTWQGIFIALFCIIVLTNIDNIVRMMVSKRIGDVHPLVTVLGIIIGLKFFGLAGLVFGPLLISYFMIFMRLFYQQHNTDKQNKQVTTTKQDDNVIVRMLEKYLISVFPEKKKKI